MKIIKLLFVTLLITGCVQDTYLKTIQFKLDMNGVENVSKVGIRGSNLPLSWNETLLITDDNNDGIYEVTIELQSASYDIEFKFVNNSNQFELKDQNNRSIRFEYKPETILYKAIFDNEKESITKIK